MDSVSEEGALVVSEEFTKMLGYRTIQQ